MAKKLISYVLPVFNESEGIETFYTELSKSLSKIQKKYDTQLVFVNDGSRDESLEKLLAIQKKDNSVIVLDFSRNFGHQKAITAGIDIAEGDAIIIMDTDLQDPPAVSLELIKKWEDGFEVVYAQRNVREKETWFKKMTASVYYRLLEKLAEISIPRNTGDFRLMDKRVVDEFRKMREENRFVRGMVAYLGFKQTAVLFDRPQRFAGETHYPLKKMLRLALDGITSFSSYPLRLVMKVGFWVSFLSFIGIIWVIILHFFFKGVTVPGWTTIVSAVLFMGGLQLFSIGIMGLYVGRIYSETQNRPLYILSKVHRSAKNDKK
jgi:glycosyltransferase involved in cell wall biosynthesis